MEHKAINCDITNCKNEAVRWFDTKNISGEFDMKAKDTFYLCEGHSEELSPEDEYITFLNPETGTIKKIELAVYSCSEECSDCN